MPIVALLRSLSDRQAIPQERRNYWNIPDYNPGRVLASRKGVFERNGTLGEDIYSHPHFIPYLRFFLFGAELPDEMISAFEAGVGDPAWASSSDIVPIGKLPRDLTRRHGLDKSSAADELFKLCLDMGLELSTAESVLRARSGRFASKTRCSPYFGAEPAASATLRTVISRTRASDSVTGSIRNAVALSGLKR